LSHTLGQLMISVEFLPMNLSIETGVRFIYEN